MESLWELWWKEVLTEGFIQGLINQFKDSMKVSWWMDRVIPHWGYISYNVGVLEFTAERNEGIV